MTDKEWIEEWKKNNNINDDLFYRIIKKFIIVYFDDKMLEYIKQ